MAVTIYDVAKAAGVSRGTVDRVLHNRPNVHPLARKHVLEALQKTGYEMPSSTKSAQVQKRMTILIPPWTDSYFNRQVTRGIRQAERFIKDESFEIVERYLQSRSPDELIDAMEEEVANGSSGLIIRAENRHEITSKTDELISRDIKIITYDSDLPDSQRLCYFGQDLIRSGNIAAGMMAKLIHPGEQVLVVTGNMLIECHKGRVDGFCRRFMELGFDSSSYHIVECHELADMTSQIVEQTLRTNPRVRGIYMATQSVPGCIDGIRRAKPKFMPHVIVNDLTPSAKSYLQRSLVDLVIDQTFYQKSFKAILAMYQILMQNRKPNREIYYTDLSIISQEML